MLPPEQGLHLELSQLRRPALQRGEGGLAQVTRQPSYRRRLSLPLGPRVSRAMARLHPVSAPRRFV